MDDKEVIISIITENIKLFMSKNLPSKQKISIIKNKIRERLKDQKYSIKTAQLAKFIVEYLCKIKTITSQEDLDIIADKSAYLKRYLVQKDYDLYRCEDEIEIDDSVLEKLDIGEIKSKREKLKDKKVIKEIIKEEMEIKEEELKEELMLETNLEKQKILEEWEKLEQFKQYIGDISQISEDTLLEEIKEIKLETKYLDSNFTWYEDLGLKAHPFPSEDGLENIDKDDYELIVLKTRIFEKYIDIISKNPNLLLNKSFIIYGDYGCGKTTLFDYLSYLLIKKHILPIRIILGGEPSLERIKRVFNKEIFRILSESLSIHGEDPRTYIMGRDNQDILLVFKTILEKPTFKGFM
ncbi:MAG: hypothetical protein ACFFCS_18420, partial [Candidatus Hodarchaeota archaeon]